MSTQPKTINWDALIRGSRIRGQLYRDPEVFERELVAPGIGRHLSQRKIAVCSLLGVRARWDELIEQPYGRVDFFDPAVITDYEKHPAKIFIAISRVFQARQQ